MGAEQTGFKRVSDDKPIDISLIPEDDTGLYYKDEPYTTKRLHQRLIITYSPKYARYQRTLRSRQVEHAQKMIDSGKTKKERRNPNDPARFIGTMAVTQDGELPASISSSMKKRLNPKLNPMDSMQSAPICWMMM